MSTSTNSFTSADLQILINASRGFVGRGTLHEQYARYIADAVDRHNPFLEEYRNGERIELRSRAFRGETAALAELEKKTDRSSKKDFATARLAHLVSVILTFEKGAKYVADILPESTAWEESGFKTKIDSALGWVTACNAGEKPDMANIMHHNDEASTRNSMTTHLTPAFETALRKLQHTSPAALKAIATEMAETPDTYTIHGKIASAFRAARAHLPL